MVMVSLWSSNGVSALAVLQTGWLWRYCREKVGPKNNETELLDL